MSFLLNYIKKNIFCILGSVPPLYREIYDIVCPNQEHVDQDMFVNILVRTSLPKATVIQVFLNICIEQCHRNKLNYLYAHKATSKIV